MPSTRKFDRPPGWRFDHFTSYSGFNIRYGYVAAPADKHRGTVVLTGGYARHIEYYYEAINNWRDRGYSVYAMDWAGMGGSEREFPDQPLRPPALSFEKHARILNEFVQNIVRPPAEKPAFLCTHSFGGHIALRYLHMFEKRPDFPFNGVIMGAPMVDINTSLIPRPVFKRLLSAFNRAGFADVPLPQVSKMYTDFVNAVLYRNVEHDPERETTLDLMRTQTEPLHIGYPTPGWLLAAMRSADIVRRPRFLQKIDTPVLVLTAERDSMVSVKAQERTALYLPNAALVKLQGARHGLWYDNDRVQTQLWNAVSTFTAGLCARHRPRPVRQDPALPDDLPPGVMLPPPPPAAGPRQP